MQPKPFFALFLVIAVAIVTAWVVHRFHRPGHLDVIAAQAMDMSQMRPPTGAAPVALAAVRTGSLSDTITYTGSVQAYNEEDISPRITGTILSLPVYPGDQVHAGQLIAQLDSAEVSAKTRQTVADVQEAQINEQIAHLTHRLHHGAALDQANAAVAVAQQGIPDAQAEAQADQDAVTDAEAGVESAQANAAYWKTEIAREKQLTDAGAASRQEYQNELAQAQAAFAAVDQARAKVSESKATAQAAQIKILQAHRQVDAAAAGLRMAQADIAIAQGQAQQAGAGVSAAQAQAQEAAVVEGYTRVTSPASGVVIARPVSAGTLVQAGTVILKVADIDRVRVQANVATADLGGIHPGSPVEIAAQDGHRAIAAKVTSVFPSANMDSRTAIVEAVIANPVHRLLPGAYVSMRIATHTGRDKLLVPVSAVVSQGGQSFIWIAKETTPSGPATAHEVTAHIGGSDGTWIEVASDELTPNEQVVTQGQAGLAEGARVVSTVWGSNGPESLPDAAGANAGRTVYRCEICGMTYSEADARKNHFVDPMDGGKLVAVKPDSSN